MSQYFAAMFRRRPNEGWFRVGRYDATTVDIISVLAIASMFIWAISPDQLFARLVFNGAAVRSGEIWRLVTWPIAEIPGFFALISIAFFWSFGQQLEALFGKVKFLAWVLAVAIVPGVVLALLGLLDSTFDFNVSFGLGPLFLAGIWVYAATYPNVRWFDVVPLWAIAAVFTGLQLLQFTGSRDSGAILFLLVSVAVALSAGRSLGLASAWPIPHIPIDVSSGPRRRSSGRGRAKPTKPKRPEGGPGQRVVEGPWRSPAAPMPPPPGSAPASPGDQAELDDLLDKIGSHGMDSLSGAEKQRLNELSKRLRNR
ncbi:DUF6576 domain-containing protein [Ilumatobacter sp.]|uniref:DUF6576 domain-containing protein n=1 Tax=Ilumatobacter sp. TaxID=1967498 RepID=UPI003B5303B8